MSRSGPGIPDSIKWGPFLFLAMLVALVFGTFMDAGIYWDEPTWGAYGWTVVNFFRSGGTDDAALRYSNWYYYGGLYDGFLDVMRRLSPMTEVDTRHLVNGLVGVAGVGAVMALAGRLAGPAAGLSAGVMLAVHPSWWGQIFTNPKDIPFAVFHAWALVAGFALIRAPRGKLARYSVLAGFTAGLAMAVRTGGVLLLGYLALALLVRRWVSRESRWGMRVLFREVALPLLLLVMVAWAVMVAVWPYALLHPLTGPVRSFFAFSRFEFDPALRTLSILVNGVMHPVSNLPRSYLATYITRCSPEPWIVLVIGGILYTAAVLVRARSRAEREAAAGLGLSALAGLFPVVYIAAAHIPVYTGMRHILFVLPPLSVLAGVASVRAWESALGWGKKARWGMVAAMGTWLVFHIAQLAVLHPYEYLYFNPVSGGLKGAQGKFELDDSSHTLREAASILVEHVRREEGPAFGKKSYKVFVCPSPFSAAPEFTPNFQLMGDGSKADFALYTAHSVCSRIRGHRIIGVVERLGVPLAWVADLR